MRTARRLTTLLTVVCLGALGLLAAAPASAGGPTSVLVVDTDAGRATALYYSDADYSTLDGLLGFGSPDIGSRDVPDEAEAARRWSGPMVTVTWLIHDVTIWRVDRILPGAADGPWIFTSTMGDGGTMPEDGTWHRPAQPEKLDALLERLFDDVSDVSDDASDASPAAAVTSAAAVGDISVGPVTSDPTPSPAAQAAALPSTAGWSPGIALILGLVVGAVVTLLGVRFARRNT